MSEFQIQYLQFLWPPRDEPLLHLDVKSFGSLSQISVDLCSLLYGGLIEILDRGNHANPIEELMVKYQVNFEYLKNRLLSSTNFLNLSAVTSNSESSWFGFSLVLKESSGVKPNDLVNFVNQNEIGLRLLFAGNLTKQPSISERNYPVSGELTNTYVTIHQTFSLGTLPELGSVQTDYTPEKLEEFF